MLTRICTLAAALAVWGCATDMGIGSIERDLRAQRIDEAVRKVDALAASQPSSYRVQALRGAVHQDAALRRLAAKDEAAYLTHFETALDAYARASRFDPRRAAPHSGVGYLLFHQGNLQGALEEYRVARMLEPGNPIHYANLAELYVYMGRIGRARTMVERGRKLGLPPVFAETVEMLASWRQGDLVDAKDLFDLANQDPEAMRAWLQSEPGAPPSFATFDEFTGYCCGSTTCGPNMAGACQSLSLEVAQREVAAETLRREREAALASQRALRETFGGTREIEIAGEDEEAGEEAPAESP